MQRGLARSSPCVRPPATLGACSNLLWLCSQLPPPLREPTCFAQNYPLSLTGETSPLRCRREAAVARSGACSSLLVVAPMSLPGAAPRKSCGCTSALALSGARRAVGWQHRSPPPLTRRPAFGCCATSLVKVGVLVAELAIYGSRRPPACARRSSALHCRALTARSPQCSRGASPRCGKKTWLDCATLPVQTR